MIANSLLTISWQNDHIHQRCLQPQHHTSQPHQCKPTAIASQAQVRQISHWQFGLIIPNCILRGVYPTPFLPAYSRVSAGGGCARHQKCASRELFHEGTQYFAAQQLVHFSFCGRQTATRHGFCCTDLPFALVSEGECAALKFWTPGVRYWTSWPYTYRDRQLEYGFDF
ncbi:hypothetical protein EJ08DRAFT_654193 [Tothia fuscella]|uniref:Uncharacterized protein n=1 Tax=Tothia fuscella TaxID=1048955 RepID=A0A9P4TSP3_9PEZI|nr:hypothetical protein EJ08DRAFT_654193 [Tothia fuscella]